MDGGYEEGPVRATFGLQRIFVVVYGEEYVLDGGVGGEVGVEG